MISPRLLLIVLFGALQLPLSASPTSPSSPHPVTAKEAAQGYRDGRILALPIASRLTSVTQAEQTEGLQVQATFPELGNLRLIQLQGNEAVSEAVERLKATGRYEYVEPDHLMKIDSTIPNDPGFSSQWGLSNPGTLSGSVAGADIQAIYAWDILHDAPDVIAAVIDTGVRLDHVDLAPNLWRNPAPTFGDINGASYLSGTRGADVAGVAAHGSHVAGIICAAGNNGAGTVGVAWKTQLMVLRNSDASGYSNASDSALCVSYAVAHGAKVINCSFGGSAYSTTFYNSLKAARDAGVIVVCSAGNDGTNNDSSPHYPSNYLLDNLVVVGNSTPAEARASSSNYGASVDLFAPGTSILSTDFSTTAGTITFSGTSMATPHVTGTLTLLWEKFPNETYSQIINRLLRSTDYKTKYVSYASTSGRLNLYRALSSTSNAPFNDNLVGAAIVGGNTLSLRANNADATQETGELAHTANGTHSVWWAWYASTSGTYAVDTSGSTYDTALDVYTSSTTTPTYTSLTSVGGSDDAGGKTTSRVTFTATSGRYYFIAITGKDGQAGHTQLNLAPTPDNDNLESAIILTGSDAQAAGDNTAATAQTGEPGILGNSPSASLWYRWVAPADGQYQISAIATFDALLAVYRGTQMSELVAIATSDDTDPNATIKNSNSSCSITAVGGVAYYIQVDTKSTSRGTVVVSVTTPSWLFSNAASAFTSAPTVGADGTVYVGACAPDGRLYAISSTGAYKWSYVTSEGINLAPPTIGNDGTIYQGCFDGFIVALNPDGTLKWKHDFGANTCYGIATATDGTLYARSEATLYALNPSDGSTKWQFNLNTSGASDDDIDLTYSGPVVGPDGTIYQASDADLCLYAINPDGTRKWKYATGALMYSTPAVDATSNVYFANYSPAAILSLDATGAKRWSYAIPSSSYISGSPTLGAGGSALYIGASNGILYSLFTSNGLVNWTYSTSSAIMGSSPAIDANGVIYVGAYDGYLYGITSAGTLQRRWATGQAIRSSPVISGKTLYLAAGDTKLYAFAMGAGIADSPWPQFRQNVRHNARGQSDVVAIWATPEARNLAVSDSYTLSVQAGGPAPLTFQWYKDGTALSGATASTYTIASASMSDAGAYTVKVTSSAGSVTSSAAIVSISTVNIGRVGNMAIRATVAAGEILTIGATISNGTDGLAQKPLLIRGVGPTLGSFNVSNYLPDPVLTVFNSQRAPIATNDGWKDNPEIATADKANGAFDLAIGSADAAVFTKLAVSAGYTVQVAGKRGSGVVLVELYDANPGAFTTGTARLTNISALNQVGIGDNVLVAGFVITGGTAKKLLIRGIGPGLKAWASDFVVNPKLELHRTENGRATLITENDDWGGSDTIIAAAKSVAAFDLEKDSKDAVLVVTLNPGSYTATVKGVNNTTGKGMVEIYELK